MIEKLFKFITRRVTVILLFLFNLAFIIYTLYSTSLLSNFVAFSMTLVSYAVVVYVVSCNKKTDYKLIWSITILFFPIFGGLFYLIIRSDRTERKYNELDSYILDKNRELIYNNENVSRKTSESFPSREGLVRYLEGAGFPVCESNEVEYFSCGEELFDAMKRELEKAEKYIFLEYFIIEEGFFWGSILDILKRKSESGVTVRVIYDDVGCLTRLSPDYKNKLAKMGIECVAFNRIRPFVTSAQNNRNHRKITVIDGKVAFTGGVNLADEYINRGCRLGKWKDCGILVRGDSAREFAISFLRMWEISYTNKPLKKRIKENLFSSFSDFIEGEAKKEGSVPVQFYCDSPLDTEKVGESVYMKIITGASRYLYIFTPYLIIDENILSALELSAKSGVDVRIITPGVGDRKFVHLTTRSYYRELISAGVKIYEYKEGFVHSKTFVSDDEITTVGTFNLDYRSLYLHFECGAVIYGRNTAECAKNDFLKTVEISREISLDDCKDNWFVRRLKNIYRLFAPLM